MDIGEMVKNLKKEAEARKAFDEQVLSIERPVKEYIGSIVQASFLMEEQVLKAKRNIAMHTAAISDASHILRNTFSAVSSLDRYSSEMAKASSESTPPPIASPIGPSTAN